MMNTREHFFGGDSSSQLEFTETLKSVPVLLRDFCVCVCENYF